MFAHPQIEQMAREQLQAKQLEKLQKQLRWAQEKSRFYQEHFAQAGADWQSVETLADLRKMPFLTDTDLYRTDSLDMLTLPLTSVLRYACMEEESGDFTHLYTNGDIAHNVEMMARTLVSTGVNQTSSIGLLCDLSDSRFQDVQYAAEFVGAAVVPMSLEYRHWLRLIEHVSIDTLIGTPQLVLQLIIQLQAAGKDIAHYPLTRVICMNPQGIQNPMARHIHERTKAEVYTIYAPAALGAAGLLYPCEGHEGQHLQEDHYYAELIAFNSDEPVTDPHQMGELVVTTLDAEAMPLIRYRTGQAVSFDTSPCSCGRTLLRVKTPFSFF
jgi:phenylacetate-CoA ligase